MKNQKFVAKSFDLGMASAAVLAAFGVQIVLQLILSLFSLPNKAYTWTVVILNQVVFIAVALGFCFMQKVDPLAVTGAKNPPKWYYFPLFILVAICCVTCFAPMSGLFTRFLAKLGYEHKPNYYIPLNNGGLFALAFLALTILPALGEESMIRGVLMSGAKRKSPLFAIFFTALIFALIHGNLHQLIHQFLLGAVAGYLAHLTGGIYASIMVHMTNNAMALLLDYGFANNFVNHKFYYYLAGEMGAAPTLVGVVVSFFALTMLLTLITCLMHRDRSVKKDYEPTEARLLAKVNAYLTFLSTPDAESEAQAKAEQGSNKKLSGNTLLMTIVLVVVLATVVLVTLIPGGKG